jgi:ABC-2 type transport system ATP-binding protein
VIEAVGLTKRYGATSAVEELSFTVRPGVVTGFLGPNGAGKSTTMRLIVGLDRPSSGRVTVNGRRYAEHPAPLAEVGALFETRAAHPGRSAHDHLLALAATHGIAGGRVDELIEIVGLTGVATRRVGDYSLGMGQRLGIAAALLADPAVVVLDEPVNGLDAEGVVWVRTLVKRLAAEGRTVLVSSHLMNEMAVTADHVIVLGRGRLIADMPMAELLRSASAGTVRVRSPEAGRLAVLLAGAAVSIEVAPGGVLRVVGTTAERIGDLACAHGVAVHELIREDASLEQAFMELTAEAADHRVDASAVAGSGG